MNSSPDLDFTSDGFDPVKVLASRSVCLPFPRAKTYNNLAEYYTHTVLKKNVAENCKKKEIACERNYSWYIETLGLKGPRATIFEKKLRGNRGRNRRRGKKPISITYVPSSPLRSGKVMKLASNYKKYWQRKRLLFKKSESRSLFQKIKFLATPISATELIKKAIQNSTVQTASKIETKLVTNSNTSDITSKEKNPATKSVGEFKEIPILTYSDIGQNVDLPCQEQCVDATNSKGSSKVESFHNPEKHSSAVKSKIHPVVSQRVENSTKNSNSPQPENVLCKITARNLEQNHSEIGSTSEETTSSFQTKLKCPDCVKCVNKPSIKVQINCKLISTKHLKSKGRVKTTKENGCAPIKRCTCFPKISVELSSQCKCGFYSTAMKNLRKFKIPRKKS